MFKRLENPKLPRQEWTRNGTLINKPETGWLHPDKQLEPHAGVIYGVRYIGCMEVKESMKSLDFDTRTLVAKESINLVCEAAGLKTSLKKTKKNSRIQHLLGERPNLLFAGSNVNLSITTDGLVITVMESGEVIVHNTMPTISFASGGDPDTMDFVAYVAKDPTFGRACHVLECGGGLAQDVITTIGQAFELRFKQHLAQKPAVQIPQRVNSSFSPDADSWGDENEYYNDRPGAKPPSPSLPSSYETAHPVNGVAAAAMEQEACCEKQDLSLIDFSDLPQPAPRNGHSEFTVLPSMPPSYAHAAATSPIACNNVPPSYTVTGAASKEATHPAGLPPPYSLGGAVKEPAMTREEIDAFDMKPFCNTLPEHDGHLDPKLPYNEKWFLGAVTRQQCEALLKRDGDFLVRESASTPGQFVLSGRHRGRIRHLLLVDPEGKVRTKDQIFDSVSHLVNYHLQNRLPILSNDSEVVLITPVCRP